MFLFQMQMTPQKLVVGFLLALVILEYYFNIILNAKTTIYFISDRITKDNCEIKDKRLNVAMEINKANKNGTNNNNPQANKSYTNFNLTANQIITKVSTIILSTFGVKLNSINVKNNSNSPICSQKVDPLLNGKIPVVQFPVPQIQELEHRLNWVHFGGHWKPKNCSINTTVAIVIPYRDRESHLHLFLQHMHPFLERQQLDYTMFVIEQNGTGPFNRAMLMNIGFMEAMKIYNFTCFVFHDVDLLPEDGRNIYNCPRQPRHMSVAVDIFNYKLPYPGIFGGVSAISTEHFKLLNGFSNSFFGWGGEDDDMFNRIMHRRLNITRYDHNIARYTMLTHRKEKPNPSRFAVLKHGKRKFDKDGLNSLKYKIVLKKLYLLYTWILVDIHIP